MISVLGVHKLSVYLTLIKCYFILCLNCAVAKRHSWAAEPAEHKY